MDTGGDRGGSYRRCDRSRRHQLLPRARGRADHRQPVARVCQPHRRPEQRREAQVVRLGGRAPRGRRPGRHQVRPGRERQALAKPLPEHAHGCGGDHPRCLHGRHPLPERVGSLPVAERRRSAPHDAAPARPGAGRPRRDPRGAAPRALPQLPPGRDPHAHPARRGIRLHDRHVSARARGLQGRRSHRRAWSRRQHLQRLVGVQGRGHGRSPLQRRPHARGRRRSLVQLRLVGTGPAPEHRGRQSGPLRRRRAPGGAQVRHPQPRQATAHRSPMRLARDGQRR